MTASTLAIAPYGSWVSPVSTDMVAGQTIGLGALSADGGDLLWLESRPQEAGRSVLVRRRPDGSVADLTPAPFNVGTRVHEYGGGAFTAADGRIVFSNKPDGSVWLIDPDAEADAAPRPVAQVAGCRFADFRIGFGGTVALCVREDHRDAGREAVAAIVALDLTGAVPPDRNDGQVLVTGPDFLSSPRLSPKQDRLCWISWAHPDMPWDATQLFVAGIDRKPGGVPGQALVIGKPRQLAGKMREAVVQPDWSPEGVLHFCSDRSGWWNLYRFVEEAAHVCAMRAEIGGPHWVFGQRFYDFAADGRILAVRIADGQTELVALHAGHAERLALGEMAEPPVMLPDDALAFIATPHDAPARIVLLPHGAHASGGAGRVQIRAAGESLLDPADISAGESLLFPVEGGGTGQAFWYPPVNRTHRAPAGTLPPAIVTVHGGPTAMAGRGFSPRVQWWTSRGIGVLDVNYRGSTGFGRAFRQLLDGQWGVADVADCIAAARHLAETGRADSARLAIRGGSAGGFTVLMALAGSAVFSAGASHYGVAELHLLAADTHKFESRYLDRLIGKLPEAAALYDARSPVNHVDRMRCPVIFFQGLDDKVVPPNQARAMTAAMRARGLWAPLFEFEGEAHGFRKADTIRRVLELETGFYGKVFGFRPAGLQEDIGDPPPL